MRLPQPLAFFGLALCLARVLPVAGEHPIVPLWPDGAPGSEARKGEPETVKGGSVSNIHHPTLTVYLPARDTNKAPSGAWPERFREWLADRKFLQPP